jgi:DNA-binding Lrp family transcriptional regulator
MKDKELRLISELMKNSRRSDRELAKALGISQPTVSRLISRLQKEGVIKEYTMVPDFCKLGFNLIAFIMFKLKPMSPEQFQEQRKAARELDSKEHRPYLLIMSGIGLGKDLVFISFHKDYGDYAAYMSDMKEAASSKMKAYMNAESIESFLIDLNNQDHYQPLTLSKLATHIQTKENNKKQKSPAQLTNLV